MTATASTTTALPPALPPVPEPRDERSPLRAVLDALSSMKVTVVLLLLLGVLTFAGTLAQEHLSVFDAQREFFESLFVIWDTHVAIGSWTSNGVPVTIKVPLVGGYTILVALFVNLAIGGVIRHRWTLRNAGILITHLGIGLLLVAGFVKLHWSHTGHVSLFERQSSRTMVSFHDYELALLRQDGDQIVERVVPQSVLSGAANGVVSITGPDLPFTVQVSQWLDNAMPRQKGPMVQAAGPVVTDPDGTQLFLEPVPYSKDGQLAGCVVKVVERVGLGEQSTVLFGADRGGLSPTRKPFTFTVDGTTWGLDLRHERRDLPFEITLDDFQKSDHPGTMTPRDFSSWVTVRENESTAPRQVHIYMNHPLRSHDHVFFQASWGPDPNSGMQGPPFWSVFEVSQNPSDAWPKYASYVVLLGLLVHFLTKLARYLMSSTYRSTV